MREAVIVSAVRTPIGKMRGSLATVPVEVLGAHVAKEAVRRAGIEPEKIDEVVFSNIRNNDVRGIARMVSLTAGFPMSVPGITVERMCGSALNSLAYASILIEAGYADIVVAGGAESDSRYPYLLDRPASPYPAAPPEWSVQKTSPVEIYGNPDMGITAENIAEKYGIDRKSCDEFSMWSHQKAAKAIEAGYFDEQIVPVEVPKKKGETVLVSRDEMVRADCNMEALSKLPPVFKKGGIVTAGNSSPMSDGASAMVVMEKDLAKSLGLEILGKFAGYAAAGVDPNIMGIGPVASTSKLLKNKGMNLADIDLIELNEAFASQSLACIRELGLDMDKINVNGGAIAHGHPTGATGGMLVAKMVYELKRRNLQTGLITFCCGGGQGVSVLIQRD